METKPGKRKEMNFEQLHKELVTAQETDEKLQRENDAKFRAVEQKVETYDQFAAIVKGCHLRPLDKKESICHLSRSLPNWNGAAQQIQKESLISDVNKYFPPRKS